MKKKRFLIGLMVFAQWSFAQTASEYFNRGLDAYQNKDYNQANLFFDKTIQQKPKHTLAYLGKGMVFTSQTNYNEAIFQFNKAIEFDPNYAQSYMGRARVYWYMSNWAKSLEDCNKVIYLQPLMASAYFLKGRLLVQKGQYEEALKVFDQAERFDSINTNHLADKKKATESLIPTASSSFKIFWRAPYAPAYSEKPIIVAESQLFIEATLFNNSGIDVQPNSVRVYINRQNQSGENKSSQNAKGVGRVVRENQRLGEVQVKPYGKEIDFRATVTIPEGLSEVVIGVLGANQLEVFSSPLKVQYSPVYKPNLYLYSFGIESNLSYTKADAEAIERVFKLQDGRLFDHVETKVYINTSTTGGEMRRELENISAKSFIRPQDVVILFFSGHGTEKDGDFKICGRDFLDTAPSTSLSFKEDVLQNLKHLKAKIIILLDACHSGHATMTDGEKFILTIADAKKLIADTPPGIVVITSSSGQESSYEDAEWGHGAFTKAIIQGIEKQNADFDADLIISIDEVFRYIEKEVPELVKTKLNREQHPAIAKKTRDFPIFSFKK